MRVIERSIHDETAAVGGDCMVRFTLDLEELDDYPTDGLPGFTDEVLALLPGLREHECPPGAPGGLVRMMHDGMCIAHLAEHVVLELEALVGAAVGHGRTRGVDGHPGVYAVMVPFRDEAVALTASRMALELLASLLPPDHRAVLGLGLLAAPIESTDADGPIPGLAALTRMVEAAPGSTGIGTPSTDGSGVAAGRSDAETLDLLAPVNLLASAELLAPADLLASIASVS
jgi:cyanophycin synthetase